MLSAAGCQTAGDAIPKMHIPIIGYEVMEERARFTVYKLRIENKNSGECWFVFRRYTDFVRLHARLKGDFPSIKLSLPKKRWFGDNFDPDFLEERIQGLQCFINAILDHKELCGAPAVKDFFCIGEPPSYAEGVEESRAIFESLEETIYHLRHQLKEKESELSKVRSSLVNESMKKEVVFQFVRNCMKNCPSCSLELSKFGLSDTVKFTSLPQKIHEVKSADDNGLRDQDEISRTQKDSLNSTSQEVLTVPRF
ncbi:sorting nexin-16 isoform X2 [Anabrus simplex]